MAKPIITKVRYRVVEAFDYLTAGREYDVEIRANKRADFRRTDGSGSGCYVSMRQFRQALASGALVTA